MTQLAEACERLVHDALHGDHTLFIREDETQRSRAVLEPLVERKP